MRDKILVIAVHPDDETLGCGGTLLKHKSLGDEIHWLIVTSTNQVGAARIESLEKRKKLINTVQEKYQFDSVMELGLPTTLLDTLGMGEIISKISNAIEQIQPSIIYMPFIHDVHSDHRVVFECAFSCTKVFRHPYIKKVLMMETLSETEFAPAVNGLSFIPNVYVDISGFIEQKVEILKEYKNEIGEHPFPRSIDSVKAQALLRGVGAGCEAAESFMLLKEIR